MKRFKISFLAVIAVAAMSFTIASHEGAFKKNTLKRAAETDCFLPSISSDGKDACSNTKTAFNTTSCTTASNNYPGKHVFDLVQGGSIAAANITTTCPGGNTFCCFTVTTDAAPLTNCSPTNPNQPQITIGTHTRFYAVDQIFCKQ
jgi:hypothetical protein